MPVGRWRRGPFYRRVAPVLAALVALGGTAALQAGATPEVAAGRAQALGPPDSPTDYADRGTTFHLGTTDDFQFGSRVAVSADGRYVVFDSTLPLVDEEPGDLDDNGLIDVYMIDRDVDGNGVYDEPVEDQPYPPPAAITWISEPSGPTDTEQGSLEPDISPSGRYVVFTSSVAFVDEFPNDPEGDDNGLNDIYRWDREAQDEPPTWVTDRSNGEDPIVDVSDPSVGDNGNVAFQSALPSSGDTTFRVFVRLFATESGAATYSEPAVVLQDESDDLDPDISGDGTQLAFIARDDFSDGTSLQPDSLAQFTVTDTESAHILPVDPTAGTPSEPSLSFDGSDVAYRAQVFEDEGTVSQVWVNRAAVGAPELVSRAGGDPGDRSSFEPSISADGRYVAYTTQADNILRLDPDTFTSSQVVVRDRANPAAENELVSYGGRSENPLPSSLPIDGLGDRDSYAPAVASLPGSATTPAGVPFVAFASVASNIDPEDGVDNDADDEDIFVRSFSSARLLGPASGVFDVGDGPTGVSGNIHSIEFTAEATGFGPLQVTDVAFSGDPSAFTVTVSECGQVQPGESCFVSVQFLPTSAGPVVPATLVVTYDSNPLFDERVFDREDLLTTEITLTGDGVPGAPVVLFNPTSIDFGDGTIGMESPPKDITISVTPGSTSILFTDITLTGTNPGDYKIDASDCLNRALTPGTSCRVVVTFTPGAIGPRTATIVFSTGPSDPSPRLIPLTGSGLQPTLVLNPAVVHSGGVIGVQGANWPPDQTVRVTIPDLPKVIDLVVDSNGTVQLPTVIFRSRTFGPRDVTAEVVGNSAVRLAQPVVLLVQAPGANVVDIIGRN